MTFNRVLFSFAAFAALLALGSGVTSIYHLQRADRVDYRPMIQELKGVHLIADSIRRTRACGETCPISSIAYGERERGLHAFWPVIYERLVNDPKTEPDIRKLEKVYGGSHQLQLVCVPDLQYYWRHQELRLKIAGFKNCAAVRAHTPGSFFRG